MHLCALHILLLFFNYIIGLYVLFYFIFGGGTGQLKTIRYVIMTLKCMYFFCGMSLKREYWNVLMWENDIIIIVG